MKRRKLLTVLLAFAGFINSLPVFSQDPNLYIFLCFGQSNMSGQGPFTDDDLIVDSRFKVLRAADHSGQTVGDFYPGAPRLGHSGSQMGPADFFGRKMVEMLPPEITVAVSNIAIGGQSIKLFDKATNASVIAQGRSINDWWIPYLDEYGGDPYQRIIEMGEIAKQKGVIKGILFHQGEADGSLTDWPVRVKKVYDDIIADLQLNQDEVPMLLGEMLRTEEGGVCGNLNPRVAEAANLIPNGHLIPATGCKIMLSDGLNVHFTREGYQILGERYADTMLSLMPIMQGYPKVTIVSPALTASFSSPASITISADATDTDGTIAKVEFFNGTTRLGEVASAPYSYIWTNVATGTYTIRIVATDNDGNSASTQRTVTVNIPQTPYGGTPKPIPGIIQLEEYDEGGANNAYFDSSPGSSVTPAVNFRTTEDVDIEPCTDTDGGYNVGYSIAGEWLEYTVNVASAGTYMLTLRAACSNTGRSVSLDAKGLSIAKDIAIPNTGGWQAWQDVVVNNVALEAGVQIIRLTIGAQDYVNLNYMSFTLVSAASPSLQLHAGWNAVGCPISGSTDIASALSSVWSQVEAVKNTEGFYLTSNTQALNTLSQLEWGKGYMVKVKADCKLDWTIK